MQSGALQVVSLIYLVTIFPIILIISLPSTLGIKCYECVYVKGRTDKSCLDHPKKELLVDCDVYSAAAPTENPGDPVVNDYQYCEVAIGCLDRGKGRRPSLHRACSPGNSKLLSQEVEITMADFKILEDGTKIAITTPATTTTTDVFNIPDPLAGEDPLSNKSVTRVNALTCEQLEDGETIGLSIIMNLHACYCDTDACNTITGSQGANVMTLKKQLETVCDRSPNLFPPSAIQVVGSLLLYFGLFIQ